jgi:hypothetical protein
MWMWMNRPTRSRPAGVGSDASYPDSSVHDITPQLGPRSGVCWRRGVHVCHVGGTFRDFEPNKVRALFKGEGDHAAGAAAA